jgi:flagellar hook protein FlgE
VGDSGFTTVGDMLSFFQRGLGIDTNITGEPKPGVVLEGSRIVITGNVGDDNALTLPGSGFTNASGSAPLSFAGGSDADGNRDNPNGESVYTSFDVYDSRGHQVRVDVSAVLESTSDTDSTWRFFITSPDAVTGDPATESLVIGNGTLVFDNEGKLMSSTNTTISLPRNEQGAKTPMSIKLDFGAMTSLVSQASEMVMTRQDGMPTGTLDAFSVGSDGTITGSYNNGLTKTLGQVIVAVFANPQGLVDVGGNMYVTGANSGEPTRTIPMSMGAGAIKAGALELSNVDLSEEFINLIISSTGFSAASRVITTSDQLLTELLNTSR